MRGLTAAAVGLAGFVLYAATARVVPFHPDESSWIRMSRDVDVALRHPSDLVWRPGDPMTADVGARLLDGPLTKYAIGLGRWASGYGGETTNDWDWLASWSDNVLAGAMPGPGLLRSARFTAMVVSALSLAVFFLVANDIAGRSVAVIGTLLLSTHPIELLHLRRAMAECTAQCFSLLAVLAIVRLASAPVADGRYRPWAALWVGIAVGLAVSAKQTATPLAIVALGVAVHLSSTLMPRERVTAMIASAFLVTLASIGTFLAVNPVLYRQPVPAARLMVTLRQQLVASQLDDLAREAPTEILPNAVARLGAIYREVFWRPPAFSDVPTYDAEIAADAALYTRQPLARAWNLWWVRVTFLATALVGFGRFVCDIIRDGLNAKTRGRQIVLAWLAGQTAFVVLFVPMDWQRYFIPLLPPIAILAGDGALFCINRVTRPLAATTTSARTLDSVSGDP